MSKIQCAIITLCLALSSQAVAILGGCNPFVSVLLVLNVFLANVVGINRGGNNHE